MPALDSKLRSYPTSFPHGENGETRDTETRGAA